MEIAVSHCGDAYHETGIVNGKGSAHRPTQGSQAQNGAAGVRKASMAESPASKDKPTTCPLSLIALALLRTHQSAEVEQVDSIIDRGMRTTLAVCGVAHDLAGRVDAQRDAESTASVPTFFQHAGAVQKAITGIAARLKANLRFGRKNSDHKVHNQSQVWKGDS